MNDKKVVRKKYHFNIIREKLKEVKFIPESLQMRRRFCHHSIPCKKLRIEIINL